MQKPAHPDFLVYWTGGKDIDLGDTGWKANGDCVLDEDRCEKYLKRLEGILKFGLWLMRGDVPHVSQICFSELRLSEARQHALKYGRLGIGFKRPYVFNRLGRPVVYHHPDMQGRDWFPQHLLFGPPKCEISRFLCAFLKEMHNENDLYGCLHESEWRIIWSDEVSQYLKKQGHDFSSFFRRPNDVKGFEKWCMANGITNRPDYLMPLNEPGMEYSQWLHLIIYPDIRVKAKAHTQPNPTETEKLLFMLKPPLDLGSVSWGKQTAPWERYVPVIEMDLDSCNNF